VISFVKKGRDYSEEDQGIQASGADPRRELPFSIDVKGGEIVTLM
jgi:hypothetical protein